MRRRLATLVVLLGALVAASPAAAFPPAPAVDASAALVATGGGEILYAYNPNRRLPMASITKLMTALVVLQHNKPSRVVTVRPAAAATGESTVNLKTGERLTVHDLLAAALIQSANDAAVALAAGTSNGNIPAFVARMNARARAMGLSNTHFANPDGLDAPGHYSSARDILALARAAMTKPIVRGLVRMRTAHIAGGRSLFTWNDLLSTYPGVFGVKTGHTDDAGWCEVAVARRNGSAVYAVVLGSATRAGRNAALARLLTWGLDHYARIPVIQAGTPYATASVPFEDGVRLPLVATNPVGALVRVDEPVVERVVAPRSVKAPVARGDRLGEVRVLQRGKVVAEAPLVAGRDVAAPSFAHRVAWYAGRALDEAGDMLGSILPG
ncbi:MAG TPA: D-alanyl-D-alanine carboxypeptidase family protein [Gaiellaceae bacterium]|jgi:D-alanyl-D-alanine carboxypeptidase (penicillin-binding protein 5/6)